jgi:hypothetical protein
MPKYSLTKKDKAYLTIEIEGKNYDIPLANTLTVKEARNLIKLDKKSEDEQVDFIFGFFSKYLGEDVVENLVLGDLYELFTLWGKANAEVGGLTLGESSASQSS